MLLHITGKLSQSSITLKRLKWKIGMLGQVDGIDNNQD
jgi:hypothetical protein